jgi:hypothetical protein
MVLTGFRLILLICLFVFSALALTARQTAYRETPRLVAAATIESPHEEPPRQVEPVAVDAVGEAGTDMPLQGNVQTAESIPSLPERLDRNDVVAVAVDQKDGRTGDNVPSQVLGAGKKAGKAHNPRYRARTAKPNVKRHHRALAKANKRKRLVRKAKPSKFAVQKRVKRWRSVAYTAPTLAWIAEGQLEPLPSAKRVSRAGLRRVR